MCPNVTRNGITVKRSSQFKDVAGNVQQAFDTLTTNSVNTQSATSGTLTFDRAADSASNRGPGSEDNPWPGLPSIRRIFVRGLTPESYGNAIGIGMADVTTDRLVRL